ncbi:MAG: RnfABCDGE type electron transport complex subunit D [Bdellovibrionota bacterium]
MRRIDARAFQIVALAFLLSAGVLRWHFVIDPLQMLLCFSSALGCQWILGRWAKKKTFNWMSPWITASSLLLLLKCNALWSHPLAAALAIGSKFVFRWKGKHFFNPANFAIVICTLLLPCWVSPGQWGREILLISFTILVGSGVTQRAQTWWVSLGFLLSFATLLGARIAYLEYEWTIWLHQLSNGVLLIFAFFMISDPKTTPRSTQGIFVHGLAVAVLGFFFIFHEYEFNGLLYSLFLLAPTVPLLDRHLSSRAIG